MKTHTHQSLATMALLILLLLSTFASTTILVYAAKIKDDNVFIDGSGSVELTWKSGKTQTITGTDFTDYANLNGLDTVTFIPTWGWHIAAVSIDGVPQEGFDEDGFSLTGVKIRNLIEVTFAGNTGEDGVAFGYNVESYPTSEVFLIFDNVLNEGFAYAYTYSDIYHPLVPRSEAWDVTTTALFDQNVIVILVVSLSSLPPEFNPYDLTLWSTDIGVARADVTFDGVVNGDDVSTVGNANPSSEGDPNYDPRLDQDGNGVINDDDVNIVNDYIGQSVVWTNITVDVIVDELVGFAYVRGNTEHFSLFCSF